MTVSGVRTAPPNLSVTLLQLEHMKRGKQAEVVFLGIPVRSLV